MGVVVKHLPLMMKLSLISRMHLNRQGSFRSGNHPTKPRCARRYRDSLRRALDAGDCCFAACVISGSFPRFSLFPLGRASPVRPSATLRGHTPLGGFGGADEARRKKNDNESIYIYGPSTGAPSGANDGSRSLFVFSSLKLYCPIN